MVLSTLVAAVDLPHLAYFVSRRGDLAASRARCRRLGVGERERADLADSAVGQGGKQFIPLGVTIFLFILICNWLDYPADDHAPGPVGAILPSPTGDVNLPWPWRDS